MLNHADKIESPVTVEIRHVDRPDGGCGIVIRPICCIGLC